MGTVDLGYPNSTLVLLEKATVERMWLAQQKARIEAESSDPGPESVLLGGYFLARASR